MGDGAGVNRLDEELSIFRILRQITVNPKFSTTWSKGLTFSNCPSKVLTNSFFKNPTTSSTFLPEIISSAIPRAFLRTSISGQTRTLRMSMTSSSRICSCLAWRAETRERTIVLTLLDGSSRMREMRH